MPHGLLRLRKRVPHRLFGLRFRLLGLLRLWRHLLDLYLLHVLLRLRLCLRVSNHMLHQLWNRVRLWMPDYLLHKLRNRLRLWVSHQLRDRLFHRLRLWVSDGLPGRMLRQLRFRVP